MEVPIPGSRLPDDINDQPYQETGEDEEQEPAQYGHPEAGPAGIGEAYEERDT